MLSVRKISHGEFKGCFQVHLYYRYPMEDMFESILHYAAFEDEADAHKLIERISDKVFRSNRARVLGPHFGARDVINMDHWLWPVSQASCDGYHHSPCTAVVTRIPAIKY